MKEILKRIDKADIYDTYYKLIDEPIDYNRITRYTAHELILEQLTMRPDLIPYLLTSAQLNTVVELVHSELMENNVVVETSVNTFLINFFHLTFLFESYKVIDGLYYFFMNEEIWCFLKTYEPDLKYKEAQYFQTIIKGFIEIHGMMPLDYIERFYEEHRDHQYDSNDVPSLETVPLLQKQLEVSGIILIQGVVLHLSVIVNKLNLNYGHHLYPFDIEDYYEYGQFGTSKLVWNHMIESGFRPQDIYELTEHSYDLLQNNSNISQYIKLLNLDETMDPDIIFFLLNQPLWAFGGDSAYDLMEVSEMTSVSKDMISPLKRFIQGFASFTNLNHPMSTRMFDYNDLELLHILEEGLIRKDSVDAFIEAHTVIPENVQEMFHEALSYSFTLQSAIAFNLSEGELLVFKEGCVYHLYGFEESFEMAGMLPSNLPTVVDVAIMPFEGKLVSIAAIRYLPQEAVASSMFDDFLKEFKDVITITNLSDLIRLKDPKRMS